MGEITNWSDSRTIRSDSVYYSKGPVTVFPVVCRFDGGAGYKLNYQAILDLLDRKFSPSRVQPLLLSGGNAAAALQRTTEQMTNDDSF